MNEMIMTEGSRIIQENIALRQENRRMAAELEGLRRDKTRLENMLGIMKREAARVQKERIERYERIGAENRKSGIRKVIEVLNGKNQLSAAKTTLVISVLACGIITLIGLIWGVSV